MKGYSAKVDSAQIVNAFHAVCLALKAKVYVEYVRSKANVADYPSRGKITKMTRHIKRAGLPPSMYCTPTIPDVTCCIAV